MKMLAGNIVIPCNALSVTPNPADRNTGIMPVMYLRLVNVIAVSIFDDESSRRRIQHTVIGDFTPENRIPLCMQQRIGTGRYFFRYQ